MKFLNQEEKDEAIVDAKKVVAEAKGDEAIQDAKDALAEAENAVIS